MDAHLADAISDFADAVGVGVLGRDNNAVDSVSGKEFDGCTLLFVEVIVKVDVINADDFWKYFVAGFLELISWSLVFVLGGNSEAVKGFFVAFAKKDDGADAAIWFAKAN